MVKLKGDPIEKGYYFDAWTNQQPEIFTYEEFNKLYKLNKKTGMPYDEYVEKRNALISDFQKSLEWGGFDH